MRTKEIENALKNTKAVIERIAINYEKKINKLDYIKYGISFHILIECKYDESSYDFFESSEIYFNIDEDLINENTFVELLKEYVSYVKKDVFKNSSLKNLRKKDILIGVRVHNSDTENNIKSTREIFNEGYNLQILYDLDIMLKVITYL